MHPNDDYFKWVHTVLQLHIKWARGAAERTDTTRNKTIARQLRSSHSIFSNRQYSISIQGGWDKWLILVNGLELLCGKGSHQLLRAGSRGHTWTITVTDVPNRVYYCVIFVVQGYSKWLSESYTIHTRCNPVWFLSMELRQGSDLCSSSSCNYPGTEGTNQNRHSNHHRWHATNSLERTRLSCWCL